MTMVRDLGPVGRFRYLAALRLDPDDVGRIEVAGSIVAAPEMYVNAETGDSSLLQAGDAVPAGVWIPQRAIDDLHHDRDEPVQGEGFGEGFSNQAEQLGGDRSYPEEDSGGTRRLPHGAVADPTT